MSQSESSHSSSNHQGSGAANVIVALAMIGGMVLILAGLFYFSDNSRPPANPSMKDAEIEKSLSVVPDATIVIGVEVNGHAKAYRLQDLLRPDQHAINDRIGDQPVTVTHCDIDHCTRIFANPKKKELGEKGSVEKDEWKIRVAGTHRDRHGKLLLAMGDTKFWQDTGLELGSQDKKVDLRLLDFRETTWGEWKALHPDSQIHLAPWKR